MKAEYLPKMTNTSIGQRENTGKSHNSIESPFLKRWPFIFENNSPGGPIPELVGYDPIRAAHRVFLHVAD
jgi:hypothetical protein